MEGHWEEVEEKDDTDMDQDENELTDYTWEMFL